MSESHWGTAPSALTLAVGTVHVWRVGLRPADADGTRDLGLLSPDEQERAARFRRPRDGQQFARTRAALRTLLGRLAHTPPAALCFEYGASGKPSLVSSASPVPLSFNVSHSGDFALIAVCAAGEIGVDIEHVRSEFSGDDIASRFFCASEIHWLRALPDEQRPDGFFQLWTRKEAFLKACGEGIWQDLRRFDVSQSPPAPVRGRGHASSWLLHDLDPGHEYHAALAVPENVTSVMTWEWVS